MSLRSQGEPRLTPDEVQSVSFRPARLGRRGLDEAHVRAFCQQVGTELGLLLSERAALQEEVSRLRRRVLGRSEDGSRPQEAHVQAVSILSRAQETADHYVAEAQEYSRHLAQDARQRRDEILAQARSYADLVLDEADREASHAAQAAMAAPVPQSAADARGLEGELAYLNAFSDVFRARLRGYLDALLRNGDEWEPAEKPALSAVHADLPRRGA